jgi:hypothetical protein
VPRVGNLSGCRERVCLRPKNLPIREVVSERACVKILSAHLR